VTSQPPAPAGMGCSGDTQRIRHHVGPRGRVAMELSSWIIDFKNLVRFPCAAPVCSCVFFSTALVWTSTVMVLVWASLWQ